MAPWRLNRMAHLRPVALQLISVLIYVYKQRDESFSR
jgi:hypothetical protein